MTDEKILMSVDKPEAQALAEIHALRTLADAVTLQGRQVSEHMSANTRAMEKLGDQVGDLSVRVTRLEEQKHGKDIEGLREEMRGAFRRINDLESTRDQQKGAKALVDWLRQTAPWLLAIGAAVLAGLGWQKPS